MIGTELAPFGIIESVSKGIEWTTSAMGILMTEPAIYFVGFAVVGVAGGVARKFVPMKKK